jgi:hypothetical protein
VTAKRTPEAAARNFMSKNRKKQERKKREKKVGRAPLFDYFECNVSIFR